MQRGKQPYELATNIERKIQNYIANHIDRHALPIATICKIQNDEQGARISGIYFKPGTY